jgi:ClpP class serine protease
MSHVFSVGTYLSREEVQMTPEQKALEIVGRYLLQITPTYEAMTQEITQALAAAVKEEREANIEAVRKAAYHLFHFGRELSESRLADTLANAIRARGDGK